MHLGLLEHLLPSRSALADARFLKLWRVTSMPKLPCHMPMTLRRASERQLSVTLTSLMSRMLQMVQSCYLSAAAMTRAWRAHSAMAGDVITVSEMPSFLLQMALLLLAPWVRLGLFMSQQLLIVVTCVTSLAACGLSLTLHLPSRGSHACFTQSSCEGFARGTAEHLALEEATSTRQHAKWGSTRRKALLPCMKDRLCWEELGK